MFSIENTKNNISGVMKIIGYIVFFVGVIAGIVSRWDNDEFDILIGLWIWAESAVFGLLLILFGDKMSYDPNIEMSETALLIKRFSMIIITLCFIISYIFFLLSFDEYDPNPTFVVISGYLFGGSLSIGLLLYALGEKISLLNKINDNLIKIVGEGEESINNDNIELPKL